MKRQQPECTEQTYYATNNARLYTPYSIYDKWSDNSEYQEHYHER